MAKDTKNKLDIDGLAAGIADDIARLSELAKEAKPPADLRDIDFGAVLPAATLARVNAEVGRFNTDALAVAKSHEAQVKDVATEIRKTAQARQKELKKSLSEMQKSEFKDAAEAKVVMARLKGDITLVERNVADIKLASTIKPVVTVRPEVLDKKIAEIKPLRKISG